MGVSWLIERYQIIKDKLNERYQKEIVKRDDREIEYLRYGDLYFRLDVIKALNRFVIEYADNKKDAVYEVLEDGDNYPLEWDDETIFKAMISEIEA